MNEIAAGSAVAVPGFWVMMLKSLGMLCVVLAVLIGVLFMIKRLANSRGQGSDKNLIRMLSSFHVTPKERLLLMDVMGKKILIGVTQHNISRLAIFEDSEVPEAEDTPPDSLFKGILTKMSRESYPDEAVS